MQFASLGSGSTGNASLVQKNDTLLMVDCGFSMRETERRLQRLGRNPDEVTAILITHEHTDHVQGAARFSRRYGVPVWMTAGTRSACRDLPENLCEFSSHESFAIDDVGIHPYPVPHDAREPAQFIFDDGQWRLGMLTDTGSLTPHIEQQLTACDALLLECNHDPQLLAGSSYPPSVQARIAGDYGHLSNQQSARLLQRLDCSRLQHMVAAHLSEKNNRPDLAVNALAGALDCHPDWIGVITQQTGLDWRTLG